MGEREEEDSRMLPVVVVAFVLIGVGVAYGVYPRLKAYGGEALAGGHFPFNLIRFSRQSRAPSPPPSLAAPGAKSDLPPTLEDMMAILVRASDDPAVAGVVAK